MSGFCYLVKVIGFMMMFRYWFVWLVLSFEKIMKVLVWMCCVRWC